MLARIILYFMALYTATSEIYGGSHQPVVCKRILNSIIRDAEPHLTDFSSGVFRYWKNAVTFKNENEVSFDHELSENLRIPYRGDFDRLVHQIGIELDKLSANLMLDKGLNVETNSSKFSKGFDRVRSTWLESKRPQAIAKSIEDLKGLWRERSGSATYRDMVAGVELWLELKNQKPFITNELFHRALKNSVRSRARIRVSNAFVEMAQETLRKIKAWDLKDAGDYIRIPQDGNVYTFPNRITAMRLRLFTFRSLTIEDFNYIRFLPVYILGLVTKPTYADDFPRDTRGFLIHDLTHTERLIDADSDHFKGDLKFGLESVRRRLRFWNRLTERLDALTESERAAAHLWIFYLTHEEGVRFDEYELEQVLGLRNQYAISYRLKETDFGTEVPTEVAEAVHAKLLKILQNLRRSSN